MNERIDTNLKNPKKNKVITIKKLKDAERVLRVLRVFLVCLLTMTAMYKLSIGGDHFVE